jgi:D-alanyl-D-alanine carboxypeptidase
MAPPARRPARLPARRRRFPQLLLLAGAIALVAFPAAPLVRQGLDLPLAAGEAARALGPLPACRYDDIRTLPRDYDDWAITLVDTILRLPRWYAPPDLVSVSQAEIEGNGRLRALLIDDLREMAADASAADAGIAIQSAYRSYQQQVETFDYWVAQLGRDRALRVSARPGHSEHQLGLGVDFRSEAGGTPFEGDWGQTKAGTWMAANAWQYGFLMSYPKGKRKVTCYDYEPWHFRYVGRELAATIRASGLTIREYLWLHHTTAVVPPPAQSPPSGAPTPGPTASPEPSPTLEPSPSPTATPIPSQSPSAPPSSPPSADPSHAVSPAPSPPPAPAPIGTVAPEVLAAGLAGLALLAAIALLWLRRGRSGAVL